MKKILTAFAAILLLGAGCSQAEPAQEKADSNGTIGYTNKSAGYSFRYPQELNIYKNAPIGDGKGDWFSFPDEMIDQSIFEPEIKIISSKGDCTATGELVSLGEKEFTKVVEEDGAAGNNHVTESYFINNNDICYHLSFYTNRARPENYASSADQAQRFQAAQDESLRKMRGAFEGIAASLTFLK